MPDWKRIVRERLAALDLDPTVEADIVEELSGHLEDRFHELTSQGIPPNAAETILLADGLSDRALSDALAGHRKRQHSSPLGGTERPGWFGGLRADFRYAVRALRKRPGLTLIAVITLTLGIGVNTAIFGYVNALLVRPLPFEQSEQLVTFWGTAPEKGLPVVNYPEALYDYYHKRLRAVQPLAMYGRSDFTFSGRGDPERLNGVSATAEFFRVLRVTPQLGRTFLNEEYTRGNEQAVILSDRLWQRRFAADSTIIGQTLTLDNVPMTVVGVMRPGFEFPSGAALWTPMSIDPQSLNCWCYDAIGRLTPGSTTETMAREVDALNADFWAEREGRPREPPSERRGTIVRPLARHLVGDVRQPLLLLLGAAAMVLVIACANLANLLLASTADRQRELAVRCSLGASPRRIVRQLLLESFCLSTTGALGGLLLAVVAMRAANPFIVERVPHIGSVGLDVTMLLFTVATALVAGMFFGAIPALRGAGVTVAAALKEGLRTTSDKSARQLNDLFVVAQLALSLMLLVGAGLMLHSLRNLLGVDPGFRAEQVTVGRVSLPWNKYSSRPTHEAFVARLVGTLQNVPGISAIGLSSTAPFSANNNQQEFVVEGKEPATGEPIPVASVRGVSDSYFDAIGTPLLSGRTFTANDRTGAPLVAIIDKSTADRYWPRSNPIGARIAVGSRENIQWRTIVGVVATVRHQSLERPPDHYVYGPLAQIPILS
ncbi:MAG TPA: ABC transporter permease, partial [Gemmatimonadaceae bacterium]|nr:ABC transporter permease [Gemmatimonadaceae bacterium]